MTAQILGTNVGFILLAFAPPILWLLFYLREDRHPEPKRLLLVAFLGGMAAAIVALFAECSFAFLAQGSCSGQTGIVMFLGIALIEEFAKYLPVRFLIMKRPDFDEPVDAMIYMMTAALGFAAVENALFSFSFFFKIMESASVVLPLAAEKTIVSLPLSKVSLLAGLDLASKRFIGANLLHALSSGIVGFFLARAYFSPRRHHFVALGILTASLLHTGFNYLILKRGDLLNPLPQATFYLIFLLSVMAVMVFIDFERLKGSANR